MSCHLPDTDMPDLRLLPHFRHINQTIHANLLQKIIKQTHSKDEVLFLQGDKAQGMYVVESGYIRIYRMRSDGAEQTIVIAGEGDTFNDIPAFDGGSCPAHAIALTESVVWLLPSHALDTAIEDDPKLARHIVTVFSQRIRSLIDQIEDLTLYNVIARLARFLLKEQRKQGLQDAAITRIVIANYLATTPESLSRALRKLEASGAIISNRHDIIIQNEDKLRAIADIYDF